MSRLTTDNYKKPLMTMTENLSDADIKKKLDGYEKVSDNSKLEKGNNVRYFVLNEKTGGYLFRLGGKVLNMDNYPTYIVLGSGTKTGYKSWCVQNPTKVIFFRKKTALEIANEYNMEIIKQKKLVNGLVDTNKDLLKEIKMLKDQIKKNKK